MRAIAVVLVVAACGETTTPVMMGGDGVVDPAELCDAGETVSCNSLGAAWASGEARCKASCGGWDTSSCVADASGGDETVKPAERDPARFETARCNDGTPFSFRVSLAPQPSATWMIHLQGGGFCDDNARTCATREMVLKTTTPRADRTLRPAELHGIMSRSTSVNPTFANVNLVAAQYCSSDFWTGATTERRPTMGDPVNGWYFSGRANVAALLAMLTERYGLDDDNPALEVLWTGDSAGAHGAHFNFDQAARALPRTLAAKRVWYLADAGWMIDWDDPAARIENTSVPDREVWRAALALWGGSLDPSCEAANTDKIACWFGPGWYPHIAARAPVFVQQSSIDSVIGIELHGLMPSPTAMKWRQEVIASFAPVTWLFTGGMPYHVLTIDDAPFSNVGPDGSKLNQMVGRFFENGAPERVSF